MKSLGAAAFQHEIGQRPRRTGETDERGLVAEPGLDEFQCARDVGQAFGQRGNIQALDVGRRVQREIHLDAAAVAKFVALAEAFGDHEDVAEQNRRVEVEPADRLERDLGGEFGRPDQFQKGMLFLQFAVFRQGAAGLPHQPDGRAIHRAAMAGVEKPPAVRWLARHVRSAWDWRWWSWWPWILSALQLHSY